MERIGIRCECGETGEMEGSTEGRGDCFGLGWPAGVTVSKAERLPPPRTLVEFELRDEVEEDDAVAGGISGYGKNL